MNKHCKNDIFRKCQILWFCDFSVCQTTLSETNSPRWFTKEKSSFSSIFQDFKIFFKIPQNGWKLRKITLFHQNNTFDKTKSYFQEFRNFSQNGRGWWKKIVFSIFFKIPRNGWKLNKVTLFYENYTFNLYNQIFKNFKFSVQIAYQDGLRMKNRHFNQFFKFF